MNDPQAPVTVGDHNTVNLNYGVAPQPRPALTGTPNNLPYSGATVFVGREQALDDLHEQLQQGQTVSISAISGMGGIGKTELALQYADRQGRAGQYPGGICWLRAREEVGTQILGFARSCLDLDPPMEGDLESRVRWCWQRWRSGDVLIVLDDVQTFDQIRSVLPPRESRFKVLMTSRSRFGSPVQTYEILVLDEASSLALLRGIVSVESIDAELETAKQVCKWLGYLPLALELVGRYWQKNRNWSLAKVFEKLKEKELGARALVRSQEMTATHAGLVAAFDLSWQDLQGNAQRLGAYLSGLALAPIPWGMVEAALSEWEEEELQAARSRLVDFSLITDLENGWYELHPLIRLFFVSKLPESEGAEAWKQGLCRVAVGVCQQIEPSITIQRVQEVLPIMPHLEIVAQTLAQDYCEDEDLIGAFVGVARFYEGQGLYQQAEGWSEKCLQVVRDRLGAAHPDVATSLNNLAFLYASQGRYSEAEPLYQEALALRQQLLGAAHPDVATSLNNLAGLYRSQGRYSEAEPLYQEAIQIHLKALGEDHPDFAIDLCNLAGLYTTLERYPEAEPLYLHALTVFYQRLGEAHPYTQRTLQGLANLIFQATQASRTSELSDHPLTRALLEHLQSNPQTPENDRP